MLHSLADCLRARRSEHAHYGAIGAHYRMHRLPDDPTNVSLEEVGDVMRWGAAAKGGIF